jgi:hypothetical protein
MPNSLRFSLITAKKRSTNQTRFKPRNPLKLRSLPLLALTCFLIAGCTSVQKSNDKAAAIEKLGDNTSCSQIIEEIRLFNFGYGDPLQSGRETAAIVSTSFATAIALVAQPYLVISGIVDQFRKRNIRVKRVAILDEIVGLARAKSCQPPTFNRENTAGIRMPTELEAGLSMATPETEVLPTPRYCYRPQDKEERVYLVGLKNLDPDEYLRFFTKGRYTKNVKIKASHILYAKAALPKMKVFGSQGRSRHGLWVERLNTGERRQLNTLPGNPRCNSGGDLTVDYLNWWVVVRDESTN